MAGAHHISLAPGRDRRYAMWPFMWVMWPPDVHPEAICTDNSQRACNAILDLQTLELLERDLP
jgi:hypothetical protein